MKKFLSLVLALAMTLSLVTISAGAKDFTDSDELSGVVYEEAVNVMSEMEIIDGYADGDFRPQGTLTRGAAAKIIACMMLGKTTAEALGTQAAPFKDVPVGSTFAGYIAYCVEAGLIDGYADGTFRPQGTLTGFAFLKMLLTALGYDSSIEGYTGPNWTVNVMGRATQIGLTDGNDEFVGNRAATREEACLYAVNTLKATLVEYENKGQEIVVSDGTVINVRPSAPTYVTSNIAGAATSIDDTYDNTRQDYTVEFAEKYQPDLTLKGTTDVFGRPAHIWTWKNDEVGTYVDYDKLVAEYTTKVTGKDLYDLLGKAALDECSGRVYTYVDGETTRDVLQGAYFTENNIVRDNKDGIGGTGNGVLTQVFHDTRNDEITVAVINTYLAKAAEDYDEKNDDVELKVYAITDAGHVGQYVKDTTMTENMVVEGEDFDIAEVADGDLFLVTVADGEIQTMAAPEVLAGSTVTTFKINKYVISGGTQYDFSSSAMYDEETLENWTDGTADPNLKNLTYDIILDPYGYAIGVKLVEEPNQYLLLTGVDQNNSYLGTKNADATAIFLDGRIDGIKVNLRDSRGLDNNGRPAGAGTLLDQYDDTTYGQINTWCTYTVDSNGVYTLRQVPTTVYDSDNVATRDVYKVMQRAQNVGNGNTVKINEKNISLRGAGASGDAFARAYGDDETIYINVDYMNDLATINLPAGGTCEIIDDVDSVTVGVKNVNLEVYNLNDPNQEIFTLHDDDGDIIAVVTIGEDVGSTTNFAYIVGDVSRESYDAEKDEWSWTLPAIVNGKKVDLQEVGDSLKILDTMDEGKWYEVRYDANGNVRGVKGNVPGHDEIIFNDADKFVDDIQGLQKDFENNDIVLAYVDYTGGAKLDFDHGTLYVNTNTRTGFAVSDAVNVTLCLADAKQNAFDDVDDSYTGYSGLEKALRNLDDEDGDLVGYLSVLFENGRATSIILDDRTGKQAHDYNPLEDMVVTVKMYDVDTDKLLGTDTITVEGDGTVSSKLVNAINDKPLQATEYNTYLKDRWGTNYAPVPAGDQDALTYVEGDEYEVIFYYRAQAEANPMTVQVVYEDANGEPISQEMRSVPAVAGQSFVSVALEPETAPAQADLADYDVTTKYPEYISYVSGGFARVTYKVEQVKFAVAATTDYAAGGAAEVEVIAPAGKKISAGDTVTIKFTPKDHGWNPGHADGFTAVGTNCITGTVSATFVEADTDYFEVKVVVTAVDDDCSIKISWS